jgi:hypothetical protein
MARSSRLNLGVASLGLVEPVSFQWIHGPHCTGMSPDGAGANNMLHGLLCGGALMYYSCHMVMFTHRGWRAEAPHCPAPPHTAASMPNLDSVGSSSAVGTRSACGTSTGESAVAAAVVVCVVKEDSPATAAAVFVSAVEDGFAVAAAARGWCSGRGIRLRVYVGAKS